MNTQHTSSVDSRSRNVPLFLAGIACFVLGPVIYAVQMRAGSLRVPWYWPALATLGALCMAGSAWKHRGVLRIAGLIVFSIFCGMEWFFFGFATKTPVYDGPARVGAKLPAFAAAHADGRAFTDKSLEDGIRSVLVFFRGRW